MRKIVQRLSVILFTGCFSTRALLGGEGEERLFLETFEAAWSQVGESYYDADFGGLDWEEVGERYRSEVRKAADMDAVRRLIKAMLYELGDSHLALLRATSEEANPILPWSGGWAGVELCYVGDSMVFYRVDPLAAGYAAGIRSGDTLIELNGKKLRSFRRAAGVSGLPKHLHRYNALASVGSRFRAGVGDELALVVLGPDGRKRTIALELGEYRGRTTDPLGHMGRLPLVLETGILEDGVAYLRFDLWFLAAMPEVRAFIRELPEGTPGLIIDLRGNPGGLMLMAGGLAGMLLDEQSELGRTTLRQGHMNVVGFPQEGRYLGKVALLVDEASASTSEVFAIGMQELGRARVFGQPTPGAALPSAIIALPNGDSLQVALGDFRTPDGVSLEGRGVVPDEIVTISPVDLSLGKDKVLEAARNWILTPQ